MIYGYDCTIGENNVHIENSKRCKSRAVMELVLSGAMCYPSQVWNRSMDSLVREWCAHNLLYDLGLWRDHTADVDLNYPQRSKWVEVVWFILSIFYYA